LLGLRIGLSVGWRRPPRRKEEEEEAMTSLLDRPITAASNDRRMSLARCQAVANTREIIEIKYDLHQSVNV